MRFENQVAIVTGAGRGIGHAIAVRLAREGARVACVSRTENAEKTAGEIDAARAGAAKAYVVDVPNYTDVQRSGEQILNDFGRVNIPVNNAGVTRDMLSMAMSPEDWDVVLNTNLNGAFNFVQAAMVDDQTASQSYYQHQLSHRPANAIAPGYIATDSTSALSEEIQKSIQERIPLLRVGTPEDVASAVAFAASSEAS